MITSITTTGSCDAAIQVGLLFKGFQSNIKDNEFSDI